ncbi:MAG: sigma-70 family RNA polymerase sigma factor [Planctomycetota bacterium]
MSARVQRVARETRDAKLTEVWKEFAEGTAASARLNTALMDNFREHRNLEAYSLLYELNYKEFLLVIMKRVRFASYQLDSNDILQDVFVSIFRYPHKFRDEKDFSFRNWSYSIIRNTVLKHLRASTATVSTESFGDSIEDEQQASPLGTLVKAESLEECGFLWLLFLANYLDIFNKRLNERERKALTLVEVKGVRYREASAELGIKLENLKMVICRARKKIFRRITEIAGGES